MPHLVSLLLFICLSCVVVTEAKTAEVTKRPNILIVMVDDMGFSDLGCYGGEIETPVMDKLAANGLRFTQFYNTAKCHSSRVSLLSGMYCMQAGTLSIRPDSKSRKCLGSSARRSNHRSAPIMFGPGISWTTIGRPSRKCA